MISGKQDRAMEARPRRLGVPSVLAFALVSAVPGAVLGQACIGSPAMPGQFTLGAEMAFMDGGTGYGVNSQANMAGPFAAQASIGVVNVDDIDDNITNLGVKLAYELPTDGFSACPVVGLGYSFWSTRMFGVDMDIAGINVPVGFGVGTRVATQGDLAIIPSGVLGLQYTRATFKASAAGESFSETESETDFFFDGGATLALRQLYLRLGIGRVFQEDADTVISVGVGVLF